MAKITGALLSLGGSGTIAKTITFSKWKGRAYARQRVVPANPNSTAQALTRGVFSDASNIWKNAGALLIAPWNSFASGQVLTGRNAFMSSYVAALRAELDRELMIFSPGSKGGVAPVSVAAAAGVTSADVTIVPPTPPTGWTVTSVTAVAIPNVAPDAGTDFATVAGSDLTDPYVVTLSGLTTAQEYVVGGFVVWAKPDGSVAYGPSLNDLVTPT